MKIYVPKHQHLMPQASPENPHILSDLLVEIDRRDLRKIILHWGLWENYTKETDPSALWQSVKQICTHPIRNGSIEQMPFLWRPAITVHCGSKSGSLGFRDIFLRNMREAGALIAKRGFNLWYGGGDAGLMGETMNGYKDELKKKRFPHQYSVQVVPGDFVLGVESKNGRRPANEGLGSLSDVAIVMPDFVRRRDLLDSICVAAISGPGGAGTKDEMFDVMVHYKTGKRNTLLYLLNPFIPDLGHGYYDHLLQHFEVEIFCGLEKRENLDCLTVMDSPWEIMADLMKRLDSMGKNPHEVFKLNRNAFRPAKEKKVNHGKLLRLSR